MEEPSFFSLLMQSWHLSRARLRFLLFGSCIALPLAAQFLLPLPDHQEPLALIRIVFSHPGFTFTFLLFHFSCLLVGKSQLIPALYTALRSTHSEHITSPSSVRFALLKKTALIETAFGLFLLLVILVLLAPSLISFMIYHTIPDTLLSLSLLAFLPIVVITLLIREFSLLYFLLSPLRLWSALERGVTLFLRQRLLTLTFGAFCFLLSLLFTFSLNLVMLGSVVLLREVGFPEIAPAASFLMSLPALAWYAVLQQSLWLTFFVALATPKNTAPQESLPFKEEVPEIPPA